MKNWINELFSVKGNISSTRVLTFLSLLLAFLLAVYGLYTNKDLAALSMLCGTFLVPAFGSKSFNKIHEVKENSNDKKD